MYLASIAPGEPCVVQVYACASGSKLRSRVMNTKFNRTPDPQELRELLRNPEAFVTTHQETAA